VEANFTGYVLGETLENLTLLNAIVSGFGNDLNNRVIGTLARIFWMAVKGLTPCRATVAMTPMSSIPSWT